MSRINNVLADLNLLRVFIMVWDTRNLTVAGQRLGLTQSAISHSLRRLRDLFDDPLFVRGVGSMTPTETAARLHAPFHEAMQLIQHAVQDSERFDPPTAERVFRVAMSDVSEFFFLPALMRWLSEDAPLVNIHVVPLDPAEVEQAMRTGEVDLTLGFVPDLGREVESRFLFTDSFVCMVRAGHPITGGTLTNERLAALGYVYASTSATGQRLTEQWLAGLGLRRRTVLRLGHFTAAPSVVRGSDLAVVFPESVARMINGDGAFALLPLPPGQPTVDIMVHAHTHFRGDAGIRWLRDSLVERFAAPSRASGSNRAAPPGPPWDGSVRHF